MSSFEVGQNDYVIQTLGGLEAERGAGVVQTPYYVVIRGSALDLKGLAGQDLDAYVRSLCLI